MCLGQPESSQSPFPPAPLQPLLMGRVRANLVLATAAVALLGRAWPRMTEGLGSASDDSSPPEAGWLPMRTAARALRCGAIGQAHRVLQDMARRGGAASLVELQPAGGRGRALRDLFDELGAALGRNPGEPSLWQMLVYCQSLWIDAMISLPGLSVSSPDEVGASLRTHPLLQRPVSSLNAQCHSGEERDDLTSMWRDVELRHASMSTDTGILSCWLCLQDELILHKHSRSLSLSLQSSPLPSCPRSRRHPLSYSSRASHIGATSEACDKWACATAPRVRG